MSVIKRTLSLPDMQSFARAIALHARAGDVVALAGDLGAGKTTFAQAFIGALMRTPEPVTSPTFTLVQCYETTQPWHIFHADLYRLKHPSELEELGLLEAFDAHVSLIEWPEIIAAQLPVDTLHIRLDMHEEAREITLGSNAPRWQQFFKEHA